MTTRNLSIENLPITALQMRPENPRLHSEKQIAQLANSIRSFGFNVPVIIDTHFRVIAGHGRVEACKRLGLTELPTIRLEHLSEQQIRAFTIADNRLTENSNWDDRLLGEQLKILSEAELEFSLEATGFEMGEIDLIIENLAPAPEGEADPADAIPEPSAIQVSKIGDLWRMGEHRVLCGNSRSRESYEVLTDGRPAQMVFTDPPYDVPISGHVSGNGKHSHREFVMGSGEMNEKEFAHFLTDVLALIAQYSQKASLHYICMDWRHMSELLAAGRSVYSELKNLCVWAKDNGGMGSFYRSQHELVFVFQNGSPSYRNNIQLGRFGRSRSNVWRYPSANSFASAKDEGDSRTAERET